MVVAQKHLTLDEFLALPERKPALEYEEGVVTRKVSPKGVHSTLQGALYWRFQQFGEAKKLAMAFTELRFSREDRSYVPDVSLYQLSRVPTDEHGDVADDFKELPDIAVEIVSPRQSVTAQIRRCWWYVANGTSIALLVDPKDRTVLVFRPREQMTVRRGEEQIELHEVLPGFELSVDELFGSLRVR
jgi:Uma2 family endonuclease